jgi:hypothetical protein
MFIIGTALGSLFVLLLGKSLAAGLGLATGCGLMCGLIIWAADRDKLPQPGDQPQGWLEMFLAAVIASDSSGSGET